MRENKDLKKSGETRSREGERVLSNFENNLQIVINQLIRILHLAGKVKSVNVKGNLTK